MATLKATCAMSARHQPILPAVRSPCWLVRAMPSWANLPRAGPVAEEGLRIAEAVDHLSSLMFASWGLGLLSLRQGHSTGPPPRTGRGICQDAQTSPLFPGWLRTWVGVHLAGRVADAVPLLTQAMEQSTTGKALPSGALSCSLGRRTSWLAAWRRRTPSPSGRWHSPVTTGTGQPGLCPAPPRRHCGASRAPRG